MALYCCLKLGIPDVIHNHDKPITLQELVSKLNIPIEKTLHLKRLMRLLIHSNFFYVTKFLIRDDKDEKEGYVPTLSSKLLLKNTSEKLEKLPSLLPFANLMLDPEFIYYWQIQGSWFEGNASTTFESCKGEFANKNPKFNKLFNEAMESNSKMMNFVVKDNKEMFVGCGKNVLHDWSDEEVLKILDKCNQSTSFARDDGKQRKAIIIEMVIDDHDRHDILVTKLLCDVTMMVNLEGKERTEDEWMRLFLKAGFSRYKITRTYGEITGSILWIVQNSNTQPYIFKVAQRENEITQVKTQVFCGKQKYHNHYRLMGINQRLGGANELFEAQAHIYRHIFNYATSMSLKCALELGIPDIIHDHEKPITIQELVSKLNFPVEKTNNLQRLMRSLLPFANLVLDPVFVTPWQFLGKWFNGNESTVFETAHETPLWKYANKNPGFNKLFNDAMASDSQMMSLVVRDSKEIFESVDSLVDVGGGTGLNAKILLEAFPEMTCTVFDLPHVVANKIETQNLKYVGGDMFHSIPSSDVVFFKNVLHNWNDECVLKILKRCREAITGASDNGKSGKVIIIDMILDENHDRHETTETKLVFDILMMVLLTGRERTKIEWEKLFVEAGFNRYKITPIFGLRSLMEVFP
ncbi:isoflavone 7-O-methyltransferase [Artemisia annua]|uniref:Isoflavone 7-O-methyltransferase n=1 Tax=Artemisia annua TaxID=35608 RepID=A0A2U1QDI0_ARTAN|nr:isoflavone 7-O-methyltransferase [Artemisia annua]